MRAIKPRPAKRRREDLKNSKIDKVIKLEYMLLQLIKDNKLDEEELNQIGQFKKIYNTFIKMNQKGLPSKIQKEYEDLRAKLLMKYL